jgi:hypothetical protein
MNAPLATTASALVLSALACTVAPSPTAARTPTTTTGTGTPTTTTGSGTPTTTSSAGAGSPSQAAGTAPAGAPRFAHLEWWGRSVFVPPKNPVPRPALRTAFMRCVRVYDPQSVQDRPANDTFRPSLTCKAVKATALATRVPPEITRWFASWLALTDGPVDASLARAYERAYDPTRSSELARPADPFPAGTLVYVETEQRSHVRETIPFVCPPPSEHPCDPPGPSYTGRSWNKVEGVELAAWIGGRNTYFRIAKPPLQWDAVAPLVTLLGGGMLELKAVLIAPSSPAGAKPLSLETPVDARATRTYLEHASAPDADTRLAFAFDRASVAIYWRDTGALAAALRMLDDELAARHGAPLPAVFATVLGTYLDTYRQLADGRLSLAAPLGLEPLVRYYFE